MAMWHKVAIGVALATSMAAGAGFAAHARMQEAESRQAPPSLVVGSGSGRLPAETASDWVSYADRVIAARVIHEAEVAGGAEVTERGEGLIGRSVTLEVTTTLWSRPHVIAPPPSFDVAAAGWAIHDGVRREFVLAGAPRLEVGHEYIIPIARFSDRTWGPIGGNAILPYEHGIIGKGERKGGDKSLSALAQSVTDDPAAALVGELTAAAPNPTAAKYSALAPDERWARVAEEMALAK